MYVRIHTPHTEEEHTLAHTEEEHTLAYTEEEHTLAPHTPTQEAQVQLTANAADTLPCVTVSRTFHG